MCPAPHMKSFVILFVLFHFTKTKKIDFLFDKSHMNFEATFVIRPSKSERMDISVSSSRKFT